MNLRAHICFKHDALMCNFVREIKAEGSSTFALILSRRLRLKVSSFDLVLIVLQANENAMKADFRV